MQRRKPQPQPAPSQRARLTVVSATPTPPAVVDDNRDDLEPWERQPRESDPAWQAFRLYRDMPHRSLSQLGRSIAGDQKRGESTVIRQITKWSAMHHWQERCHHYDVYQDRAIRAAMIRRHVRILENAQQVLAQPINVVVELLREEPLLPHLLAGAVLGELRRGRPGPALQAFVRLMTLVARTSETIAQLIPVERLARGLSTNNTTVGVVDEDALFDGEVARRSFPHLDSDPDLAASIRAVLLRAHHAAEAPAATESDATHP